MIRASSHHARVQFFRHGNSSFKVETRDTGLNVDDSVHGGSPQMMCLRYSRWRWGRRGGLLRSDWRALDVAGAVLGAEYVGVAGVFVVQGWVIFEGLMRLRAAVSELRLFGSAP